MSSASPFLWILAVVFLWVSLIMRLDPHPVVRRLGYILMPFSLVAFLLISWIFLNSLGPVQK
jgi:branched-subunit amino acid permease